MNLTSTPQRVSGSAIPSCHACIDDFCIIRGPPQASHRQYMPQIHPQRIVRFDKSLNSTIIHLPVLFPSADPPCLHQAGPQSGISSTVDSHIYPRKELKGKRGLQRHSLPMNYSRPYHHTLARVSCHLLLSIHYVQHQPGSTPGLLSIVVDPKSSPGKRAERQDSDGSAGS